MKMGFFNDHQFKTLNFSKKAFFLGKWLCIICIIIPILNLLGHVLHLGLMTKIHEDLPPMSFNSSMGIMGLAFSIFILLNRKNLRWKYFIPIVSGLAVVLGMATVFEYLFRIQLGIDNIGRPSFLASLNILLLGISILMVYFNKVRRLSQYIALFVMSISLVVITGYLFSTKNFNGFPIFPGALPMAVYSAIGFILLSIALLCVDPKKGFMNLLTSETQSGHFARGMSLAILTIPPALGYITRIGTVTGIIDITMQVSIFMLMLISIWFVITWRLTKKGEEKENEILFLTERLKASEERVKLVLDKASDGIFTADMNGNYTDVNEAGCKILGVPRRMIVGKNIRDFIPHNEFSKLEEKLKNIRPNNSVSLSEWHMKDHTDHYIPVEVSDTVLSDGRWIGIVRNISERVEAKKILQNSEQKFRSLLEQAQDAVVIVNADGDIVFVNHQLTNWFGYQGHELTGQSIEILIPDRYRKKHVTQRNGYLENPIARPMGRDLELFGRRKDGSEFPIDVALSPSESSEGRIVTAIIRDITEIKKREMETLFLSEIGKKLSESLDIDTILKMCAGMIVPKLSDCCIIRSMDDAGKIKARSIVHKDPAVVGKFEVYSNMIEETPEIQSTLNSMIAHGDPFVSIEGIKSGHVPLKPELARLVEDLHIHSFITVPLRPKSTVVGTISFVLTDSSRSFELSDVRFFQNVTSRICIALENAKLYKDATNAIKMRENILSIVSHDLKTPLTSIMMRTELISRSSENFSKKIQDFTKGINKAAEHMQKLIQDLLDFAKLESGTFQLDKRTVDIQDLIYPFVEIMKPQAAAKEIELTITVNDVKEITCDPDRIRQVISNLIGNALKFTNQGGHINLIVNRTPHGVEFCVSDDGAGISSDHLQKIFERYWQTNEARKMGSGLGLAICKALVESHGGKIWVESTKGAGSSFFFNLPVQS